jgi:hypothetical protein
MLPAKLAFQISFNISLDLLFDVTTAPHKSPAFGHVKQDNNADQDGK